MSWSPEMRKRLEAWNDMWCGDIPVAVAAALAEIDRQEVRIDELEEIVMSQNSALASARNPVTVVGLVDPDWRTVCDNLITRIARVERVIERINKAEAALAAALREE